MIFIGVVLVVGGLDGLPPERVDDPLRHEEVRDVRRVARPVLLDQLASELEEVLGRAGFVSHDARAKVQPGK